MESNQVDDMAKLDISYIRLSRNYHPEKIKNQNSQNKLLNVNQ